MLQWGADIESLGIFSPALKERFFLGAKATIGLQPADVLKAAAEILQEVEDEAELEALYWLVISGERLAPGSLETWQRLSVQALRFEHEGRPIAEKAYLTGLHLKPFLGLARQRFREVHRFDEEGAFWTPHFVWAHEDLWAFKRMAVPTRAKTATVRLSNGRTSRVVIYAGAASDVRWLAAAGRSPLPTALVLELEVLGKPRPHHSGGGGRCPRHQPRRLPSADPTARNKPRSAAFHLGLDLQQYASEGWLVVDIKEGN
jgi:hypothetical protein